MLKFKLDLAFRIEKVNRMGPSSELCGTLPVTHHKTRPDVHTYSIVYWHTFISVKTNQKPSRVTEQINKKTDTTQCQISTQAVGHKVSTIIQDGECCIAHLYSGPPS